MKKYSFKFLGSLVIILALLCGWLTVNVDAGSNFVYVDDNASGTKDGSSDHPFEKIQDALDEARDKNKNVYIRKGEYTENIKIWEGIKVNGSDRNDVKIKAKNDNDPVIKMYDDTEVLHLTVKDGQYGIFVKGGSKAYIEDCKIIDNDDDGIFAEKAETNNKNILEIRNNIISNNGWDGIYLEKRKFSIKNNEISDNSKDGVEFKKGSEGVFENNRVRANDGVGLRVAVDKSEIYIKNNTFRDNDKSGLEVGEEGMEGLISVNDKNKFYQNDKYGIVRIERAAFSGDQWNRSLKIERGIKYWDNGLGDISHLIRVY